MATPEFLPGPIDMRGHVVPHLSFLYGHKPFITKNAQTEKIFLLRGNPQFPQDLRYLRAHIVATNVELAGTGERPKAGIPCKNYPVLARAFEIKFSRRPLRKICGITSQNT